MHNKYKIHSNVTRLFLNLFNRYCITCLLLSISPFYLWAGDYLQSASSIVESTEREIRKQFGDEVLQEIYDYRMNIQQTAYATTMKLCPTYRMAMGMGGVEYHQNTSHPYYTQHESQEVRNWAIDMQAEYGNTLASSFQAWLKIVYEGAVQPFSGIGGLKADYLNQSNTSIASIKSWFYSLYTLYLIHSLGFLQASIHCLDTMDKDTIERFAHAILIVDSEMSLVSHSLLAWTGTKILNVIIHATKWSASSMGRGISYLLQRWGIPLETVKNYAQAMVIMGGGGLLTWGTYHVGKSQEQKRKEQEEFQKWFDDELKQIQEKPM